MGAMSRLSLTKSSTVMTKMSAHLGVPQFLARLYPFFTICVTIDRQCTTVFSSIKRMVMLSLPIAFSSAIGVFAPVFLRPVGQHVKVLITGAVLAPGTRRLCRKVALEA